jgi:hypothetical protein
MPRSHVNAPCGLAGGARGGAYHSADGVQFSPPASRAVCYALLHIITRDSRRPTRERACSTTYVVLVGWEDMCPDPYILISPLTSVHSLPPRCGAAREEPDCMAAWL